MRESKQRGQHRRFKRLSERIGEIVPLFDPKVGRESFFVPSGRFISSPRTSGKLKTTFCRAWIRKTEEIIAQKPMNFPFCKVVAVIDVGDLWASRIVFSMTGSITVIFGRGIPQSKSGYQRTKRNPLSVRGILIQR